MKTVAAIDEESDFDEDKEDEVAAFQNRRNPKNRTRSKNYASRPSQSGNRPGNNVNRNGKYCFYCNIQNQTQEECRKRICENKPLRDKQGRAYWPKVYIMNNGDQRSNNDFSEKDQQQQQQGFRFYCSSKKVVLSQ